MLISLFFFRFGTNFLSNFHKFPPVCTPWVPEYSPDYCSLLVSHLGGKIIRTSHVLIIEKDKALASKATSALEEAGYNVVRTTDTLDGLRKLYETHPNVIIVSTGLTVLNGESPYWMVRQASYVPILVLGANEEADKMLEHGADAYMIKPLNIDELVARVNSLLRRRPKVDSSGDGIDAVIDSNLTAQGNGPDKLTPTEYRLASCLALNRGKILDYSRLADEVWGGMAVSRGTIHFYIRRLRRKLKNIIILGLRGIGYYLPESSRGNMKDNHE